MTPISGADYIMLAKEKLEGIPLEYRDAKINDLYGRVLSNIGAYYYKIGSEERKRNLKTESYKTFAELSAGTYRRWSIKSSTAQFQQWSFIRDVNAGCLLAG